ncbi:protein kinase domain-containing protein [Chondromyces crocatus]|uniref:Protein kinase domain-containing protein n=1 Tax=Chondromyces crocatus TaxID=52 RepID=A0A0K1EMC7_CHOCO|nr:tetratricopeptide repeat protein [Chondromyces crocatus]AKT41807.1 uncharacterized protein CMC5_060180 [Chondromyces crocatus]
MGCLDENLLFELTQGLLDEAALSEAERHLDTCPRCRRAAAEALRTSEAAAPLPPPLVARGAAIGRYLVVERVGVGAMGQVFSAYDPELDRKVALKLLRPSSRSEQDEAGRRARLGREAQTLAKLSHPNVVTVFDVGTWEQQLFVALEFVAGGSARDWIARAPRTWRDVVRLWVQAGRGLAAAHAAGVVHRDVKPDNVLVRDDDRAQVTDFGLAADTRPSDTAHAARDLGLTETGALLGTPAYMAPDQLEGAPATEASDQFGFCVSLWEALYGSRPYEGTTIPELVKAARKGPPRAPLSAASSDDPASPGDVASLDATTTSAAARPPPPPAGVPLAVRRLLQRGLHPDPGQRHPSMTALVDALERVTQRPRRVGLAVVLGSVAVAAAALFVTGFTRPVQRHPACVLAEERQQAGWDDAARTTLRETFERTGLSYARQAWELVDGAVSARAEAWRGERAEACEAVVDTKAPDPLFRARMACLDERLAELTAAVEVLALGGAASVNHAAKVMSHLPPLGACAGVSAENAPAGPCAPCVAAHADVERARVFRELGRFEDAERITREALERPATPELSEARAALRLEHARALEALGRIDDAERELLDAAVAAEEVGSRAVAGEAFIELGYLVGYQRSRPDDGERWTRLADALSAEEGPVAERVASVRGVIAARRGNLPGAETHFRAAEALIQKRLGPAHPQRARALSNLANSLVHQARFDEALPLLRTSHELIVAALGADHPDAFQALNSWGAALGNSERFQEAVPVFEQVLAGYKRTLGATHPRLGTAALNLAEAHFRLGHHAEARTFYVEAADAWERALGAETADRALALAGLTQVHVAEGRCAEGLAKAEEALGICGKASCEPIDEATIAFLLAKSAVCAGRSKAEVMPVARRALSLFEVHGAAAGEQVGEVKAWLGR